MPYNIDTWKVKQIDNLCVPINEFFTHDRTDWHPEKEFHEDGSVTLSMFDLEITGKVVDDILHVSDISCYGEGSGTFMNWIIEPALKKSKGILIASCVWEGGDTVNRLIVKDGNVSWENIEL